MASLEVQIAQLLGLVVIPGLLLVLGSVLWVLTRPTHGEAPERTLLASADEEHARVRPVAVPLTKPSRASPPLNYRQPWRRPKE